MGLVLSLFTLNLFIHLPLNRLHTPGDTPPWVPSIQHTCGSVDGWGGSSKHWSQRKLRTFPTWVPAFRVPPPSDSVTVTVTETHVPRFPGVQLLSL